MEFKKKKYMKLVTIIIIIFLCSITVTMMLVMITRIRLLSFDFLIVHLTTIPLIVLIILKLIAAFRH